MARYCWIRVKEKPGKTLEQATEELKEMPTTPGNMMWVPCVCVAEPPYGECEVCLGYGRMLTLIVPGSKVLP